MGRIPRIAVKACWVWLVLIAVESVHGTLRTIFIAPRIGDFAARQISVFTGSLLILAVAYLFIRWIGAETKKSLLTVGILWLTLTIAFELIFGYFALGRPWESLASDYKIWRGGLLPIGLAVLTLAPLIAALLRGVKKSTQRG